MTLLKSRETECEARASETVDQVECDECTIRLRENTRENEKEREKQEEEKVAKLDRDGGKKIVIFLAAR